MENTKKQDVSKSTADKSDARVSFKELSKQQADKEKASAKDAKTAPVTAKPKAVDTPVKEQVTSKPEKPQKSPSMEALGMQLFKAKADDKAVLSAFSKAYKEKGITDKDFIAKRIKIYMRIAEVRVKPAKK